MTAQRDWLVVIPGNRWDDVAGTDHQLALALAQHAEVLWIDPAYPLTSLAGPRPPERGLRQVAPHLHRLQPIGPPAASRPGVRRLAEVAVQTRIRQELSTRGIRPLATVVMSARTDFPRGVGGARLFFVTDDWVAGAPMMGLSPTWLAGQMATIARHAHLVATVTPELAETVSRLPGVTTAVEVVPNGTHPFGRRDDVAREPVVGLVGQLNERLDYAAVAEVADRGVPLRIIGPRTARDATVVRQLDALLLRDNVEWIGPVAHADLGDQLARIAVGLTPYVDSEFNRASFPLKTLEYLGAGIPVVSSDLPAARWLATPHVHIAQNRVEFADTVDLLLRRRADAEQESDRVRFAETHSWAARADQVLGLVTPFARQP